MGQSRKKQAKVCHFTSVHRYNDTRILFKECASLAKQGYDTHLVAVEAPDTTVQHVHVHGVRKQGRNRIHRMTRTTWAVYKKAKSLDADIYHFHDPELIPVGLLLRAQGKQVIYDIHEDVPRAIFNRPYLSLYARRLISLIIERFENRAAGKFSTLVAATPEIGKRFEPINPRTVVINNYPLLNELHSSTPSPWQKRLPGIAYVGVITERRGIFQMVEAMQHVPAQLNATLELVGPFETLELREQVMQLPGWNRVNESGILEREQVASLLGKVRAGLTTLLPTTAYSTSQATKTFEYMSAGIPAIISNFPAWKHLEDMGCCIQVDPYDTRAIANAITFLITQPAAAEMGRRGRRAIEQYYNWETQVPKLVELYEKLLN
jgi:hypothetical protein